MVPPTRLRSLDWRDLEKHANDPAHAGERRHDRHCLGECWEQLRGRNMIDPIQSLVFGRRGEGEACHHGLRAAQPPWTGHECRPRAGVDSGAARGDTELGGRLWGLQAGSRCSLTESAPGCGATRELSREFARAHIGCLERRHERRPVKTGTSTVTVHTCNTSNTCHQCGQRDRRAKNQALPVHGMRTYREHRCQRGKKHPPERRERIARKKKQGLAGGTLVGARCRRGSGTWTAGERRPSRLDPKPASTPAKGVETPKSTEVWQGQREVDLRI